nr:uncharacterized protein LOC124813480 [Hydra vulgaris]
MTCFKYVLKNIIKKKLLLMMLVFFILMKIMFLFKLEKALGLQCYHCSASNYKTCNESSTIKECPYSSRCVTLSVEMYRKSLNVSTLSQIYKRSCAVSKYDSCEKNCRFYKNIGNFCVASCCATNLCNSKEIVIPSFIHRRSRSSAICNSSVCLIDLSIVVFLFFIKEKI